MKHFYWVNFSSVRKVPLCGSLFSKRLITHVVLNWKCNTRWKWTQSQNNGNSLDGSLSPCCLSLSFSCCLFLSSLPQIWAKYHSNNLYTLGFPDGTSGKEPTCQCRRCKREKFDPWVRMILWRRAWQPSLVFLPEESPWTDKPGRLQSKGSQRVGHNWSGIAQHSTTYTFQDIDNACYFEIIKEFRVSFRKF